MSESTLPSAGIYHDLWGKNVIVTGGASGIGAATVDQNLTCCTSNSRTNNGAFEV